MTPGPQEGFHRDHAELFSCRSSFRVLHSTSLSMTKNTAISMPYANSFHPRLPQDIERMIFELAVSENGAKASTPLLLVAKRVREW